MASPAAGRTTVRTMAAVARMRMGKVVATTSVRRLGGVAGGGGWCGGRTRNSTTAASFSALLGGPRREQQQQRRPFSRKQHQAGQQHRQHRPPLNGFVSAASDGDDPGGPTPAPPPGDDGDRHHHVGGGGFVRGDVLDLAADLSTFRPGDRLDIPYELTITEGIQDFWQSAFHSQDRIHTSRPFCRRMGLQDRVLPFSLALFLASSMTHADAAKVQVGFGRVNYLWPIFAGDTLHKTFTVESIRNTSDGNHSIVQITCDLINQRGRLCMRADKRMMFDFSHPPSADPSAAATYAMEAPRDGNGGLPGVNLHLFRDHLLSRSHVCRELQSHSLADLRPGQLILHSMGRSLTFTQSQQLCSLARLTHDRHFDTLRHGPGGTDIYGTGGTGGPSSSSSGLLVPGGLVLGIVQSAASRDFHELLHEEVLQACYVNVLHPGEMVGAVSYVHSVEPAAASSAGAGTTTTGELEIATVRTLGIKNMDVSRDLRGVDIPLALLRMGGGASAAVRARDVQRLCKASCPQLHDKIVLVMDRRILRQARRHEVFLL